MLTRCTIAVQRRPRQVVQVMEGYELLWTYVSIQMTLGSVTLSLAARKMEPECLTLTRLKSPIYDSNPPNDPKEWASTTLSEISNNLMPSGRPGNSNVQKAVKLALRKRNNKWMDTWVAISASQGMSKSRRQRGIMGRTSFSLIIVWSYIILWRSSLNCQTGNRSDQWPESWQWTVTTAISDSVTNHTLNKSSAT